MADGFAEHTEPLSLPDTLFSFKKCKNKIQKLLYTCNHRNYPSDFICNLFCRLENWFLFILLRHYLCNVLHFITGNTPEKCKDYVSGNYLFFNSFPVHNTLYSLLHRTCIHAETRNNSFFLYHECSRNSLYNHILYGHFFQTL